MEHVLRWLGALARVALTGAAPWWFSLPLERDDAAGLCGTALAIAASGFGLAHALALLALPLLRLAAGRHSRRARLSERWATRCAKVLGLATSLGALGVPLASAASPAPAAAIQITPVAGQGLGVDSPDTTTPSPAWPTGKGPGTMGATSTSASASAQPSESETPRQPPRAQTPAQDPTPGPTPNPAPSPKQPTSPAAAAAPTVATPPNGTPPKGTPPPSAGAAAPTLAPERSDLPAAPPSLPDAAGPGSSQDPLRRADPGEKFGAAPYVAPRTATELPRSFGGGERSEASVIVAAGESLWSIAARHLGGGASAQDIAVEWPRWYEANRDVIGNNPDLIQPGIKLFAPG